jgi:hypothetical protein
MYNVQRNKKFKKATLSPEYSNKLAFNSYLSAFLVEIEAFYCKLVAV